MGLGGDPRGCRATVELDEDGVSPSSAEPWVQSEGGRGPAAGHRRWQAGTSCPRRQGIDPRFGAIDYAQIAKWRYYTCRNSDRINISSDD